MPSPPAIPFPRALPWTRLRRTDARGVLSARRCVLPGDGPRRTAIVVELGDTVRVYENVCPHWSVPLDAPDGTLLTADAERLRCSVHGAEFRWEDGACIAGPCEGARLRALGARIEGEMIVVERPPLMGGDA